MTDDLTRRAVLRTFANYFEVDELTRLLRRLTLGTRRRPGSDKPGADYKEMVNGIDGMDQAVKKLTDDKRPEVIAQQLSSFLRACILAQN
ncbi:MAG: hypothetical protein CM1200mP22_00890 [Dehalococcoidia bacterium]|nr:MAG: hypothetical protein CM1200mP22_00890 [Dehalococcoidia bacterium]